MLRTEYLIILELFSFAFDFQWLYAIPWKYIIMLMLKQFWMNIKVWKEQSWEAKYQSWAFIRGDGQLIKPLE